MNYVPGTASLIDDIDSKSPPSSGGSFGSVCGALITAYVCWFGPSEKHLVLLRDGRTLIGYLRSIDQFGRTPLHALSHIKVPGGRRWCHVRS